MTEKNLAMAYLHMSMESTNGTGCLEKACNDEFPKGLLHEAWKHLHKKYAKTDILSASKLRQELHILKLKEEGDPT